MNLRVFYLTRRGLSDGYVVSSRLRRFPVALAMLFWCARGVVPLRRAALHFATASSRKHKACLKVQSKVLAYARVSFLSFHYLCRYDCL